MSRLEPFYLLNVVLFIPDFQTLCGLQLVSKMVCSVLSMVKVNPKCSFEQPLATVLKRFPNINTLFIKSPDVLNNTETLPRQITAIIIDECDGAYLVQECPFASLVVAINTLDMKECPVDLRPFFIPAAPRDQRVF